MLLLAGHWFVSIYLTIYISEYNHAGLKVFVSGFMPFKLRLVNFALFITM